MKKKTGMTLICIIIAVLMIPAMALPAMAEDVNGGSASGVTDEMCRTSYWKDLAYDPARILMTADEIAAVNTQIANSSDAAMYDMEKNIDGSTYNADSLKSTLSNLGMNRDSYYVSGKKIDKKSYTAKITDAVQSTGYTGSRKAGYAVSVGYAAVKSVPTDDVLGYSADDQDDEMQIYSMNVNEPFVIKQKCEIDGKTFYWGYCRTCSGWVNAEKLAVCSSRSQWLDAWQVNTAGKDFLVVAQDKITLEPSSVTEYSSKVMLTLGTVLKLVPDDKIPANIGERRTWHNYVVYLPVRKSDGGYEKCAALISQHYDVSIGFMPLTQANMLDTAFSCLGNRYGWSGMLESMDCSIYIKSICQCFGLYLPISTSSQMSALPSRTIDLSNMDNVLKEACIETLPAGSTLYFSGHAMMYTGTVDGKNYVISNTRYMMDEGESSVHQINSIVINPLTVKRSSGNTWLKDMSRAVVYPAFTNIGSCDISTDNNVLRISYNGTQLKEGTDFTIRRTGDRTIIMGKGSFVGAVDPQKPVVSVIPDPDHDCPLSQFSDLDVNSWYHDGIHRCLEKGLMNGVGDGRFDPDGQVTRAQLVAIIWRMEGEPKADYKMTFKDIIADQWYTEAVRWAASNRIVTGVNELTFDPEGYIIRQDFAAIIYRYADMKGKGYGEKWYYKLTFDDDDMIDSYAVQALSWCVENSIIGGVGDNRLDPKGTATRAQAAVMLQRLWDKWNA